MIITFATQKGGTGKNDISHSFCQLHYRYFRKENQCFDFDYQKSFYYKWKDDELLDIPKLYDVEIIGEEEEQPFSDFETLINLKESDEINLFDLAGTLDAKYSDLLIYSDFIVTPFEYSDVSVKSTLVFINMLGLLESEAERVFIRSKYDKGYKYLNQEAMDIELAKYGMLLPSPVFKRNCLQTINTRSLISKQKYAVEHTFDELIKYINETSKIKIQVIKKKEKIKDSIPT